MKPFFFPALGNCCCLDEVTQLTVNSNPGGVSSSELWRGGWRTEHPVLLRSEVVFSQPPISISFPVLLSRTSLHKSHLVTCSTRRKTFPDGTGHKCCAGFQSLAAVQSPVLEQKHRGPGFPRTSECFWLCTSTTDLNRKHESMWMLFSWFKSRR